MTDVFRLTLLLTLLLLIDCEVQALCFHGVILQNNQEGCMHRECTYSLDSQVACRKKERMNAILLNVVGE